MTSPVARKIGMKPGMRALIIAPPPGYLKVLTPLPEGFTVSASPNGVYAFVQIFATRFAEIGAFAKKLRKFAAPSALVWVSYPKKTSGTGTDLTRDVLREAMTDLGWSAVSIIAIDEVWSALRFRPAAQVGLRSKRSTD